MNKSDGVVDATFRFIKENHTRRHDFLLNDFGSVDTGLGVWFLRNDYINGDVAVWT